MQQYTFLNKIILRGVVGRVKITDVDGKRRVASFSVVTNYAYRLSDGYPCIETTWHEVNAWETKGGIDFDQLKKGGVVEVTGRIIVKRTSSESGEARVIHYVMTNADGIKILDGYGNNIHLSDEIAQDGSVEALYGMYRNAESALRDVLVRQLEEMLTKKNLKRLLFQEPSEVLYEDTASSRLHADNGFYNDYTLIGIEMRKPEWDPETEHLSVIGWGSDGSVEGFSPSELDVDALYTLNRFIDELFKADDVELRGDSLRFTDTSDRKIADFHPLVIE